MRPGCIHDATDGAQVQELIVLGELVQRCRAAGVQSMVEGPGHVPLDQVEANVRLEKSICDGAPFYVLGPLVTDIAPGYDHITSAIGGALAAYHGRLPVLCHRLNIYHYLLLRCQGWRDSVQDQSPCRHCPRPGKGTGPAHGPCSRALDWEAMYRKL